MLLYSKFSSIVLLKLSTINKYICLQCSCRFSNTTHTFNHASEEISYDPKTDKSLRRNEFQNGHRTIGITQSDYELAVQK